MSAKRMLLVLAVAAVGMVCWAGSAQASVINVDFNCIVNPNSYTGAAAIGGVSDTWNYITFSDGWDNTLWPTNVPLVTSTGGSSSVTLSYTGGGYCFNPWGQGTNALYGDYIGVWGGGPQGANVTLSGLTPGSYDVYAYGHS